MFPSWRRNHILLVSKVIHLHIDRIHRLVELGWNIRNHQAPFSATVCLLESCEEGDYLTTNKAEILSFQRQATL